MQWSTDIRQIKAAICDQAFIGRTWVSCPMGRVVAIRRRKGQLQVMIFGWGRWYPVEDVLIETHGRWTQDVSRIKPTHDLVDIY